MNKGIKAAFFTAAISGLANFFNKELISGGIDPVLLTALKNAIPGLIFLGLALPLWPQLKKLNKTGWLKLILVAVFAGAVPFVLFFKGLALTSAATGSFIHKTMFIWVAAIAWLFFKEKFRPWQVAGLGIMAAALTVMIKFVPSFGRGEAMVLAATIFWALEAVFIKKFLPQIDVRFLAAARMSLGSILIFGYSWWNGKLGAIGALSPASWVGIMIVGLMLSGYVYYWYRALNYSSAAVASGILTLAFPITLIVSDAWHWRILSRPEIVGLLLFSAAVYLIINSSIKPKLWPAPAQN